MYVWGAQERFLITRNGIKFLTHLESKTSRRAFWLRDIIIEFTYGYFACHLKVIDKLALISRLWQCKKGEKSAKRTITANWFTTISENRSTGRIPPTVAVRLKNFHPLQEPMRLQDLLNSARSRAEKKISHCAALRRLRHWKRTL